VNRREHRARLGVEAVFRARVSHFLDRLPDDLGKIDVTARRDLAGNDGEACGDERLAGHAADRVLREYRVENGIGNLVGDLVRVSFRHRLRGEKVTTVTAHVRIELLRAVSCARTHKL
jgi:hypothetical protein